MKKSHNAQSIQRQLDQMDSMMQRILEHLTKASRGRTSLILRDLIQVAASITSLKQSVTGYLDEYQKQVGALVGVGSAINSSFGLKRVLEEIVDSLVALLNAERGFLMLREPDGVFRVRVARGMERDDLDRESFLISKTIVRRVLESSEPVLTTNAQDDPRFGSQNSVTIFHLLSILCAPLKIKDELIGVIYVDNRAQTGLFGHNELELISAFANQAAVAIHNASLFDDLQESNAELEAAYQATLEGWVRALDMRDKETEGHTQRVTTLTRRLAQYMGVRDDSLIHITRGALLHDIGKMAIPDGILLKPAPLSLEERKLMQKHPIYAYELLNPIPFLKPALDIPYCHHEKWNGSGYPRGLKGEEIPLAARIFSIVDVWDALISNRPYRKGLPPADVYRYIRELSDIHFDPRVVEAFFNFKELLD